MVVDPLDHELFAPNSDLRRAQYRCDTCRRYKKGCRGRAPVCDSCRNRQYSCGCTWTQMEQAQTIAQSIVLPLSDRKRRKVAQNEMARDTATESPLLVKRPRGSAKAKDASASGASEGDDQMPRKKSRKHNPQQKRMQADLLAPRAEGMEEQEKVETEQPHVKSHSPSHTPSDLPLGDDASGRQPFMELDEWRARYRGPEQRAAIARKRSRLLIAVNKKEIEHRTARAFASRLQVPLTQSLFASVYQIVLACNDDLDEAQAVMDWVWALPLGCGTGTISLSGGNDARAGYIDPRDRRMRPSSEADAEQFLFCLKTYEAAGWDETKAKQCWEQVVLPNLETLKDGRDWRMCYSLGYDGASRWVEDFIKRRLQEIEGSQGRMS